MPQKSLQNAAAFLLQNASILLQNPAGITKRVDFIPKSSRYYKTCRFYSKMRQVLQNALFSTKLGITA